MSKNVSPSISQKQMCSTAVYESSGGQQFVRRHAVEDVPPRSSGRPRQAPGKPWGQNCFKGRAWKWLLVTWSLMGWKCGNGRVAALYSLTMLFWLQNIIIYITGVTPSAQEISVGPVSISTVSRCLCDPCHVLLVELKRTVSYFIIVKIDGSIIGVSRCQCLTCKIIYSDWLKKSVV
jgi:hypothetical protein